MATSTPTTAQRLKALALAHKRTIIVAVCAIVFLALLEDVLEGGLMAFDRSAWTLITTPTGYDEVLTAIAQQVSGIATPAALLVMLLIIVAFAPGSRPGLCCAINLVCVCALNVILKDLVQRPRPDFSLLGRAVETGYSFPSGHSMVAMAFFGLLVWLVWRYERNRTMRLACCAGFSLIILLIGLSRIYLGVHYASDVLAGFCVSLAWLAVYTSVVAPLLLKDPGRPRGTLKTAAASMAEGTSPDAEGETPATTAEAPNAEGEAEAPKA